MSGVRIVVKRGAGDHPVELVDQLVTNRPVAILTGKTLIDREYSNRSAVELGVNPAGHLAPGSLVEVIDGEIGPYRARLNRVVRTYVAVRDEGRVGFKADANLSLERNEDA